jgi:hypothetical protein
MEREKEKEKRTQAREVKEKQEKQDGEELFSCSPQSSSLHRALCFTS